MPDETMAGADSDWSRSRAVTELLTTPEFTLALVLLLLNDHVLKPTFANWWTGKLSDFVGLFVFSMFWCALLPGARRFVVLATATGFLLWKSPLSDSALTAWNSVVPWPLSRVVDYSDWFGLVALFPAYRVTRWRSNRTSGRRFSARRRASAVAVGLVAFAAITATSRAPSLYSVPDRTGYVVAASRTMVRSQLDSLDLRPISPFKFPWQRHRAGTADTLEILANLPHRSLRAEIEVRDAGENRTVVTLLQATTQGNLDEAEHVRNWFASEVVEPLRARIRASRQD